MARTKVFQSGNSRAVRLPKAMWQALGLKEGQTIEITKEGEALRITAAKETGTEMFARILGTVPDLFCPPQPRHHTRSKK